MLMVRTADPTPIAYGLSLFIDQPRIPRTKPGEEVVSPTGDENSCQALPGVEPDLHR